MSTDSTALLPGERIVWSGEPSRHRLLRPEDALLIPFSLLWGGFAIFWEASVLGDMGAGNGPPVFFALWGVPFVILGLYLIVGRFIVRKMALSKTRYVITDSRVVITGGVTGGRLHTSYLASLAPPVIKECSDGSGDLAFGSFPSAFDRLGSRRNSFSIWGEPLVPARFRDIPQVRHVRDLVLAAQTAARRGNPTA